MRRSATAPPGSASPPTGSDGLPCYPDPMPRFRRRPKPDCSPLAGTESAIPDQ